MPPPLNRVLFAQDLMEDEPIRPVYHNDDQKAARDLLRTPPGSPLDKISACSNAGINNFSAKIEPPPHNLSIQSSPDSPGSDSDDSSDNAESVPTLPTHWPVFPKIPDGLAVERHRIRELNIDQALEEVTCAFNAAKLVYMQQVRFSLGGRHQFSAEWEDSLKAVQAVWGPGTTASSDDGLPDWAALCIPNGLTYRFEIRVVSLDYAVGRIARLARSSWNALEANDLLKWAEHINPLARRLEHPFRPPISGPIIGRYSTAQELDEASD
ncbi:hypothetical protein DFH08DRAFT_821937 [Mycena albidolilacea]|uniref:Uncharacterized protein n=1 Tax=Mycena albidolilacea TaxID=1033008 RepID=A0AAD6Z966_9AGAR|nr:hypothetical protein DFH08DRAFT_821937 [Mycena albidolilacea]